MKHHLLLCTALTLSLAAPAFAQDSGISSNPLPEPKPLLTQAPAPVVDGNAQAPMPISSAPPEGPAATEVHITQLEEQIRQLNGKLEEAQFQIKKLSGDLEKMQKDTDYRFNEMAHLTPNDADTVAPAPTTAAGEKPKKVDQTPAPTAKTSVPEGPPPLTTAGTGVLKPPSGDDNSTGNTPRDLYNYAFRLLNQTKYEEAASAFESFTKKYPKDPLVGNAYYWQGETFYIRRDYVNAADSFRKGYEAVPTGPKAGDNLLKLAMSLDAMNRTKEACVVLQQISGKYQRTSSSIGDKAQAEQKRIGCSQQQQQ